MHLRDVCIMFLFTFMGQSFITFMLIYMGHRMVLRLVLVGGTSCMKFVSVFIGHRVYCFILSFGVLQY